MKPLPALKWDTTLVRAAKDHAEDLNRNNLKLSHTGSDGLSFDKRISKYVPSNVAAAENLAAGMKVPRNMINSFLLDTN